MADTTKTSRMGGKEAVEWLLKTALRLPKYWLIISCIFISLSMFNISWTPHKSFSLTFQVTNTTAIFFGLIWLPMLLNIFALLGGGLKTPAGEVSSAGLGELLKLLDSDTLGVIIEDTEKTEQQSSQERKEDLQKIQQEAQEVYLSRISSKDARRELQSLVERYNDVRNNLPPGSERTLQMRSLAGRMRVLAPLAGFTNSEISGFLQSKNSGERLLGLSIVRALSQKDHFEDVLSIIDNSTSAYEQYHALAVMNDIAHLLDTIQKVRLQDIINKQRNFNPEKQRWISADSDRGLLSAQILSSLQAHRLERYPK